MRLAAWIAVTLLVAAPFAAHAETLTGKVVAIADGDTITVLVDREQVKVRLAEIDAPERGQPWGKRAAQALSQKIAGHVVQVETTFNDRYGRPVGHVRYDGRDINREMVREGHAWVYRKWMRDQTLLEDEEHAQAARAGLWGLAASERTPPWEWRNAMRDSPDSISRLTGPFTCGAKRHCRDMTSCEEARFYLRSCDLRRLDGDGDGVPCETLCHR
jgi:endonuclease YncB( thermonuclease family)